MNISKKIDVEKLNKLPSYLIKIFISLIVLVALIITANKVMEYNKIKEDILSLEKQRNALIQSVEELQYYIDSEVDDEYKERMARKMGYCYPDEIIYFVE